MAGNNQMDNTRSLQDYAVPLVDSIQSSIVRPPIQANNFEIKPGTIQMLKDAAMFCGLPNEDPNEHIMNFLEICDTFKYNGVSDDAVRLRLFPFSLRDKAKSWLISMPPGSFTTWAVLAQKFLAKFFPPAKTAKLRNDITSFVQHESESLYEAWERFKDLIRRCPHHGVPEWLIVQTFYNGLLNHLRTTVDAAAGGAIMRKSAAEAYELLEEMAANSYQWPSDRSAPKKVAGVLELDAISSLAAQISLLTKKMDTFGVNACQSQVVTCDFCGDNHANGQCLETVQYVGNSNQQQHNLNSNSYHPGLRNHPNFSLSNNNQAQYSRPQYPPGFPPQQEKRSAFEDMIMQHMKKTDALLQSQATLIQSQSASLRTLENQFGQLASSLNSRPQGYLPSNTEANPKGDKEQCNAVTLRSGKELSNQVEKPKAMEKSIETETEVEKEKLSPKIIMTKEEQSPYNPPPPFPQRLHKQKLDKQFSKFLEVFKKLHINIPFAEALEQMPSYVKFMKDILSKKRRLGDFETVALTEECSAILQKKLPPKLKDPGSFTIPCTIGTQFFGRALCDLGASINLMPFSIYQKLGLGEVKPTSVTLQLADRSLTYPRGIVENILVKVEKFIFPADFIVLDMEEDREIPIILGRPFLATGRTLIDVQKGELTMRVQDQEVTFNVFKAAKCPQVSDDCHRIDVISDCVRGMFATQCIKAPLEDSIVNGSLAEQQDSLEYVDKGRIKPSIEEPPDLEHNAYWAKREWNFDIQAAWEKRMLQLNEMDEFRLQAYENAKLYKEKTKKLHYKKIFQHEFEPGQRVLLFNSRIKLFPGKLKSMWSGPFIVTKVYPYGAVEVTDESGSRCFKVNGQRLKQYFGGGIDRQQSSIELSDPQ